MKILVVGELGYHEENIVKPIILNLKEKGVSIDRLGGNFDFFVKDNYNNIVNNYFNSIPKNISNYDVVFFVDYWNMILPIFNYLRSIEDGKEIKFVSLFHGSVKFEGDVAKNIQHSTEYENYLLHSYDTIIVHDDWCKDMVDSTNDIIKPAFFPYPLQFSREIDSWSYNNMILYAHRFEYDKGSDIFMNFVEKCNNKKLDLKFIVSDSKPNYDVPDNIEFIGRVSQQELKSLCSNGGYAWSSVRSEMAHYAVFDLMSYGLTPLLNDHISYYYIPSDYRYKSLDEAIKIVEEKRTFSKSEWDVLNNKLNNLGNLTSLIIGE